MNISKKILKLILFLFILIFSGCSGSSAKLNRASKIPSGKEITFFVATDIHYLSKSLTDDGEAFQKYISSGDGKQLDYIDEIMSAFANDIKKKPDILIISGDLTNNGERKNHLELAEKLKNIEKSGISVFVIPGNHDILNPWGRSFKGSNQYKEDYINDKDFSKIYGAFGYNEALSRDMNSLSYLADPSKDIWLLMLDTCKYENNEILGFPQPDGELKPGTLEWIKNVQA
ncbi:metallophosphoesterase family protein [Fonticella tunisiensis]|uniref:Calcineurin-like phosphoesterase family protein n=1 Tax=Fonticella tunisiensis TaxID=1096341 RepID=A0A4R7KDL5_9CLOT|nr:metallophosphoesterase [Fonticella tunisiensis]TDT52075.1 calcineurin-like phosphoesterase family protein [Fonticella tunisiensis]